MPKRDHIRMGGRVFCCNTRVKIPVCNDRYALFKLPASVRGAIIRSPINPKERAMKTTKAGGVAIATAAALLFGTFAVSTASADEAKVKCTGVNSCKGQSSCKSAKNSCKGMNSCKGKGFVEMSKSDCDAAKAKAKAG
jgi:hypothetical protein